MKVFLSTVSQGLASTQCLASGRHLKVVGMNICLMNHGFHCEVLACSPFHCLKGRELELRKKTAHN